ncbi:MAG: Holliday junction branch migration protein RuvA [Anaerolineaceae bacterium]|nr:Holliday junction branch migration protein RuvA [Anaerolineaceae bacterium]NTV37340.1 Holliday junction branch migration protein RuvA [Anaerolineaceae bacterium]
MISTIHGKVIQKKEDALVIDVGGLGFLVLCTNNVLKKYEVNDICLLNTYLVVREDLLQLYGFESDAEKEMFQLMLGVNGIGPKIALVTVSTLSLEMIRKAVLAEQPEIFARVPGVGRKTAQKVILHLQGRVGNAADVFSGFSQLDVDTEVVNALTALGYSVVEAQAAVQSIPKNSPEDLESRLRYALQFFST